MSAAALDEWSRNVEHIMRGVAHALNNRAAALSAVIELSRDPLEDDVPGTIAILGSELQRLGDLSRIVRAMATPPPNAGVEAFAPTDAAADGLVVIRLEVEDRCAVAIESHSAPPVRAPRWMFVRALIALGAAANRAKGGRAGDIAIAIEGDGDWMVAHVVGIDLPTKGISPYTAELATAMGGEALENRLGFRLPTLAVLRQREGR